MNYKDEIVRHTEARLIINSLHAPKEVILYVRTKKGLQRYIYEIAKSEIQA